MKSGKTAKLIGTGAYLPQRVLSNADLEKMVETSDEWIMSRTGMKERRIAAENEQASDMGYFAAKEALEQAGVLAEELDLIVVATTTPDYIFPSTSCLLQRRLKASSAAAVDIQAACSGFIYGISLAKAYVEAGLYRKVLLVATEKLSSITNYEDRNTCILFGDGAAACLISDSGQGLTIRGAILGADGGQADLLKLPAGGSKRPASHETVSQKLHTIHMEGKEVFKHAVRRMEGATKECLEACGLNEEEISWLIPHQANIRIIEALAKRFAVPLERVFLTIHKYGNTSCSSVGIALHELLMEKRVRQGENIVLTAFGGGFTWGATVLTHD
ncbi:MAG: 3-oxoacyl-ACP synthase [Chlamydiae bacterium GWC2_50_10]|nr:MAG: 3-oxoacyl-ACP synthase [Chlamydiae bacterium GWA2_50_15]OGN53660.1 MAG: 3-oxoacyl-ACP synthase [Chlamydiae bacterium GWC2_50_10]OGN54925.1 MAG: 3-oxoacyl-ACP synthase [Chlamydiae bacterium GWF2_49_8]OGN58915.1 MAG: 3-oxoacyl-ACP synthase [Chlamydiae bacterium RIFCSPHIGHO2_02_FULL_49_29]OGN63266.1 MAG: 3-oxoacyl-ACP synthase [Chlamydiae bacterium RIFCSPHIGHO2_12_FULL_49_32]OGN67818.1 MAG: 3-oxoacyl-ACP synthase [Chlamydiae bacterium RIFCSPLOWO2_02_FULL_49_12]OGN71648.1 MAG: 3-oxoacyl-A